MQHQWDDTTEAWKNLVRKRAEFERDRHAFAGRPGLLDSSRRELEKVADAFSTEFEGLFALLGYELLTGQKIMSILEAQYRKQEKLGKDKPLPEDWRERALVGLESRLRQADLDEAELDMKTDAAKSIKKIRDDPSHPYWDAEKPGHTEAVQEMAAYYETLYPEKKK